MHVQVGHCQYSSASMALYQIIQLNAGHQYYKSGTQPSTNCGTENKISCQVFCYDFCYVTVSKHLVFQTDTFTCTKILYIGFAFHIQTHGQCMCCECGRILYYLISHNKRHIGKLRSTHT